MTALHFILPGDPATPTGGFVYDTRIIAGLRRRGIAVRDHALPDGFPDPSPAALRRAETVLSEIPNGATVVIDGLALGVLPELLGKHAGRLRLAALIHHPLADETGLPEARRAALFRSERAALALASRVVTTSRFTAERLAAFDVPAERISVAPPGVDAAPLASGSGEAGPRLLCVATLTPRKGHALLLEALARLADRPWRLVCVGSDARDPATAATTERHGAALGLSERVRFTGALQGAALAEQYRLADAFALASHYEGFGMVLREAIAHGLPVIATATGGTPEALPDGAALLVPPGDVAALAEALRRFLDEPTLRHALRQAAVAARDELPSWDEAAARFAAALGLEAGA